MLKLVMLVAAACIFFSSSACAGPFGTNMGDTPEKYENLNRINNLYYKTFSVPKPHSRLNNYMLGFAENGLARVIGYTEFDADYEGVKAGGLYQALQKALIKKYGNPSYTGGTMPGAAWTRAMGVWDKDLPENIKRITLALYSLDGVKSRVDVFYVYKNNPTPEEWDKMDEEAL